MSSSHWPVELSTDQLPRIHQQKAKCTNEYFSLMFIYNEVFQYPILILIWLCFVILTGGTNEEQVTVKGVVAQSASLPCFIDEANCGAIYFLTWSKQEHDDQWSRIYIYSDDNVNKPVNSLAGRARFSRQKSEAQLVINLLKPSDEALYKVSCPDVLKLSPCCPDMLTSSMHLTKMVNYQWHKRFTWKLPLINPSHKNRKRIFYFA